MGRDLILLFDGTSNEISAKRSNVLRLYGCLERSQEQIVWYDPGVGTFGARNGSRLLSAWQTLKGLAVASGLEDNVLEGYRFLIENWQPGDRISMFGYSRGAYSARVLSGLLHTIGLLSPAQSNMVEYAYRAYQRIPVGKGRDEKIVKSRKNSADEIALYRKALNPRRVTIHMLGLWDTVSSFFDPRSWRFSTHPFTEANPDVAIVRHALAIDERRFMFRPLRWQAEIGVASADPNDVIQDVKEVWFAGTHADVGGGYIEAESALTKVPLVWMLDEARVAGLRLDEDTIKTIVLGQNPEKPKYVTPDGKAPIKASMLSGWKFAELFAWVKEKRGDQTSSWQYRPFSYRSIENGAWIHKTAVERRTVLTDYKPPNWPEHFITVTNAQSE